MIVISNYQELGLCLSKGVNPLYFNKYIKLDINFRIEVQKNLFGIDFAQANQKYYKYCWENSTYHCENCGKKLYSGRNIVDSYSSVYVSHIISRGSAREMAIDVRNHNILCDSCHKKWESLDKEDMLIYFDNLVVIEELITDYNCNAKTIYI